ncbi:MAG: hypothetical protein HZC49_14765 [Nitrospirae bacterium]|nr:hypothetical protein [Nitrospirota bacterium]
MDNFIQRVVTEPFEKFLEMIILFLPKFLTSVIILIAGIVIGFALRLLFSRVLSAIRLDRLSGRLGIAEMLQKGGIKDTLSGLLSKIIGGLAVFTFMILSLSALDVPAVEQLLEKFFLYLPNVFVAVLVLSIGYLLSNFLGRAALIASVNAGLRISGLVGKFVKLAVMVLAVTMSLEQLGIGKETIVIAFAIIFGGIVLALAIAFGLGGRDLAKDYLEKKIKCEEKKDEINHL